MLEYHIMVRKFEQKVYNYIEQHQLITPGDRIVVGVSGGADSVCLLLVLCAISKQLGLQSEAVKVVHVHHNLRGEEADADAAFVEHLCKTLDVPFFLYKEDVALLAKKHGQTIEEAGRMLRYRCLEETAKREGAAKIAVAHHQEDAAETMLFHMVRGSGLQGMSGILPMRRQIIRPLLGQHRSEIEAYLKAKNQIYRTDATNQLLDYDRNKIRHQVIPMLRELNPQAVEHMTSMGKDLQMCEDYILQQVKKEYEACAIERQTGIALQISKLQHLHPYLQNRLLAYAIAKALGTQKDISRKHIEAVASLLDAESGSRIALPKQWEARRSFDVLVLEPANVQRVDYRYEFDGLAAEYEIPEFGSLFLQIADYTDGEAFDKKNYTKLVNYDNIKGTLCVRTPEEGDYIVIDKAGNTKKLSRVFLDEKVDGQKRKSWPVVACGKEIIWAVGLRFSMAYYVEPGTKQVLHLQYRRKGDMDGTKD